MFSRGDQFPTSGWCAGEPMWIGPSESIQPGMVCSVPDSVVAAPPVDCRVLRRAEKLCLPPEQEHMWLLIARSLVTRKLRSPKSCSKSGFLCRILKWL